jgi:hypothetical protein
MPAFKRLPRWQQRGTRMEKSAEAVVTGGDLRRGTAPSLPLVKGRIF